MGVNIYMGVKRYMDVNIYMGVKRYMGVNIYMGVKRYMGVNIYMGVCKYLCPGSTNQNWKSTRRACAKSAEWSAVRLGWATLCKVRLGLVRLGCFTVVKNKQTIICITNHKIT